jgi:hypothetical protein
MLPRNCLFKHVVEGKIDGRIEMAGRRKRRRRQLLDNLQEIESGSARWQYVVKRLWKSLWTCCKSGCGMDE